MWQKKTWKIGLDSSEEVEVEEDESESEEEEGLQVIEKKRMLNSLCLVCN